MKDRFRVALVHFPGNRKPYFFKTDINNLKRNDRLIADTARGRSVVEFRKYVSAKNFDSGKPSKWIMFREGERWLKNQMDTTVGDLIEELMTYPKDAKVTVTVGGECCENPMVALNEKYNVLDIGTT